jgi:hypothetical protein
MAGQVARATALAAGSDDATWQRAYVAAWEGDEAAYEAVKATVDGEPTDVTRLSPAARLADHLGRIEDARRFRRLIRLGPHYGEMAVSVGYDHRHPLEDEAVGTATHYYGAYTYRRDVPLDLLPAGLPGLVLVTNDPGDDDTGSDGDLTGSRQTAPVHGEPP